MIYRTNNPNVVVEGLTEQPSEIWCDNITLTLGSEFSSARITYRYGLIGDVGLKSQSPVDLSGKIIRIYDDRTDYTVDPQLFIFRGIVQPQTDMPFSDITDQEGNSIATGDTNYIAYGLDFLLDRVYIDKTYFVDSDSVIFNTTRVFCFNGKNELIKNKNTTEVLGITELTYHFSKDLTESTDLEYWNIKDIINYLLYYFAPTYESDINTMEFNFIVDYDSDMDKALQNTIKQFNPSGKTLRQCLDELLSEVNGLTWYSKSTIINDRDILYIIPVSISDEEITQGTSIVVPENTDTFSFVETRNSDIIESTAITKPTEIQYSDIYVYSEPVRVMASYQLDQDLGIFNNGWTDEDETLYSILDDQGRKDEELNNVYQRFLVKNIDNNFDYQNNYIAPSVELTQMSVNLGDNAIPEQYLVFDRTLPVPVDDTEIDKQYRQPFALVDNPNDSTKKILSDKIIGFQKFGFKTLDNRMGIELSPEINHIVAKDIFAGTSEFEAFYNFENIIITTSFYSSEVIGIKYSGLNIGYTRVKSVYIPGYHFWIGRDGTYIDANTKLTEDTIYRDDRAELKKIAKQIKAWYGKERNTGTITFNGFWNRNLIGYMITDFYSQGSFVTAGTVVSKITHDFTSGTQSTTIETDFKNIDFTKILAERGSGSIREINQRVNYLTEKVKNIPERIATSGSTGSSYNGMFKPTNSSTDLQQSIKIVDGMDSTETNCGAIQVNEFLVDVTATDLVITADAYIYLLAELVGDPATSATCTIEQSATRPEPETGKAKQIISRVTYLDSKIVSFSKEDISQAMYIWGDC